MKHVLLLLLFACLFVVVFCVLGFFVCVCGFFFFFFFLFVFVLFLFVCFVVFFFGGGGGEVGICLLLLGLVSFQFVCFYLASCYIMSFFYFRRIVIPAKQLYYTSTKPATAMECTPGLCV